MHTLYKTSLVLTILGGINWGLIGLFSFDLFGIVGGLSHVVHVVVGFAAAFVLYHMMTSLHTVETTH